MMDGGRMGKNKYNSRPKESGNEETLTRRHNLNKSRYYIPSNKSYIPSNKSQFSHYTTSAEILHR